MTKGETLSLISSKNSAIYMALRRPEQLPIICMGMVSVRGSIIRSMTSV